MGIAIGVISNDPGENGKKVGAAIKEELEDMASTIEAMHGKEFADFVVPMTTQKLTIMQIMGLTSQAPMTPRDMVFFHNLPFILASQYMEIILNRGKAFLAANKEHKTIKSEAAFIRIYEECSDMMISKMTEYMEGKKV